MMKKYVIDLELAKELKKLGVKQESEFYYFINLKDYPPFEKNGDCKLLFNKVCKVPNHFYEVYSTFTTAELLELLPSFIYGEVFNYELIICKKEFNDIYQVKYEGSEDSLIIFQSDKLPNALAKLLICCIENGYIEVKKGE